MKYLLYIFLVNCLPSILCDDWYLQIQGLELKSNNVWNYIGQDKHIILYFFTPWCKDCLQITNDWNQINEHYSSNSTLSEHIIIAKINCAEEQTVCSKLNVLNFPTIAHFIPEDQKHKKIFQSIPSYYNFLNWIDFNCQVDTYEKQEHSHDDHDHDESEYEIVVEQNLKPYDENEKWVYDVIKNDVDTQSKENLVKQILQLDQSLTEGIHLIQQKIPEFSKTINQLENRLDYIAKQILINSQQRNIFQILIAFLMLIGIIMTMVFYLRNKMLKSYSR